MGAAGSTVCVFCKARPVDPGWRPFCSERCKLLDLSRWIDGTYGIPGEPTAEANDGDGSET
jgi:uncharacterized protein